MCRFKKMFINAEKQRSTWCKLKAVRSKASKRICCMRQIISSFFCASSDVEFI